MIKINETKIFEIPSWNIEKLNEEVARLNKRASKLGCAPIQVITHKIEYVFKAQNEWDDEEKARIAIHHVELKGEGPKLHGWKFIGTLDHSEYEHPIIKAVPGETIPTQYFHADGICDHCCTNRYRKETFILLHENGDYRQIGRSCIKDFLGHNPNQTASYLESLYKLFNLLEDPEGGFYGGGSSMDLWFNKVEVLRITSALIRTYGWVSKTRARDEDISATADDVIFLMFPAHNEQERQAKRKMEAQVHWKDEEDRAIAEAAVTWLAEQDGTKDYFHNLQLINTKDEISIRNFGFWCSLVATYQIAKEELNTKARIKNVNEWIGNVKERREFNVHVSKIIPTEGYYGWTYIHKMVDNEGHSLVWFASNRGNLEEGGDYNIVGTVKKHDKYNDWKQTIITRVKIA